MITKLREDQGDLHGIIFVVVVVLSLMFNTAIIFILWMLTMYAIIRLT